MCVARTRAVPIVRRCLLLQFVPHRTVWPVQDLEDQPNVQSSPVKLDVATLADATPPVFAAGFPRSASVRDYSFAIEGQFDEPARLYVVVVPAGAPPPSAAQVSAGKDGEDGRPTFAGSGGARASEVASVVVNTQLRPSTAYDAYVVARDQTSGSNEQPHPVKVSVLTGPDATPPEIAPSYPQVVNVSDSHFDVLVQLNEAGAVFAVVVPDGALAPSPIQVRQGLDQAGLGAVAAATAAVARGARLEPGSLPRLGSSSSASHGT